jgi:hypothetical protein
VVNGVLDETALQSAPQVLSTAALANASVATQSFSSPIRAMFWADQAGQALAGYATYGTVLSLCIATQVFNVSFDVVVYKRLGGGIVKLRSESFVSNQLDQTFRLQIDTGAAPEVFGGTVLYGSVMYAGSPPDFQDDRFNRVETPMVAMDIVPYIRSIMRAKGWQVGASCQDRWLDGPYSPGKSKTDVVAQDILKMQWAMGFGYISRVIEGGFVAITASDQSIGFRDVIKRRIKDQVRNGLIRLPAGDGETVAFGTKAADLELDGDGHNFPRFNRYWIHQIPYQGDTIGLNVLTPTVTIPAVDDFLAAVANCTFRFIALGQITKTGTDHKVSVTEIGAYILDSFDFDGDQDLGYWNVKTNDVGRTSVGGGAGGTPVSNASYRDWRQRTGRGMDFTNFSDILSRQANIVFQASQAEVAP